MKQKRPLRKSHNTRFIAYVASSLDGKISLSEKKVPDWTSKEDWRQFQKGLASADAVVVGTNTFFAAKERLVKRNTFVFTSRVKKSRQEGAVTFVNPKVASLKKLFTPYQRVIIAGGGRVYQTMLEKRLLHEIYVTIEPLVFGRGKEMFIGGKKTKALKLLSAKRLNKTGTILLHYKVQ